MQIYTLNRQCPEWRYMNVGGPSDFSLSGMIASLATTLAQADVSISGVSTYDTDYLMVKNRDLERAVLALYQAGHKNHRNEMGQAQHFDIP